MTQARSSVSICTSRTDCASTYAHLPYRLDRQLPVFIDPEDLDIDVFITTHSHQDHADPETIVRMEKSIPSLSVLSTRAVCMGSAVCQRPTAG